MQEILGCYSLKTKGFHLPSPRLWTTFALYICRHLSPLSQQLCILSTPPFRVPSMAALTAAEATSGAVATTREPLPGAPIMVAAPLAARAGLVHAL
jgi:hypothetical protein